MSPSTILNLPPENVLGFVNDMQKSFYILATIAAITITTVFVANFSLANRETNRWGFKYQMISSNAQPTMMAEVIANRDFSAWQELMAKNGKIVNMSEADFNEWADTWQGIKLNNINKLWHRNWQQPSGQTGCQHSKCGRQFIDQNNDGICDNQ